jgi:hypothetical protein
VIVAEFVEGFVVDPNVLGELELAHQAGADDERRDATVHAVVGQRGPVGRAAADHPPPMCAAATPEGSSDPLVFLRIQRSDHRVR